MIDLWYSADQRAQLGRYFVYRTTDGREVMCTQVGSVAGSGWPDIVKVGEAADIGAFRGCVWEDPFRKMEHEAQMQDIPMPYEFRWGDNEAYELVEVRRHDPALVLPDPEE